ncbi:hypothetical protein [Candidatus Coxiella mudrowiae]|uniref:hypothetical protein n=1 Tax=Candidatus Coxiella mudrowiae TaxID=2054173 RepID=UPI000C282296|nr:hypothetical protein [Candidatus Coxiella mudrowiae]
MMIDSLSFDASQKNRILGILLSFKKKLKSKGITRFRNFINSNFNLNELHAKWLELIRLKEESRKDKNKKALDNILKSFKLAIESLLDSRQLPYIFREVFKQEYDYGGLI